VETSLARLGFDALDVFLLHSPPTEVLQRGEVFETLETLRAQGKIRHYGVSCRNVSDVPLCANRPGVSVLQIELNLLAPQAIAQTVPLARAADLGIMARRVLAGGLLLRSSADLRAEDAEARGEEFAALKERHQGLEKAAAEAGTTLAQMALQSLFQLCEISTVLIGTTSVEHLREHVAALNRPPLGPEPARRMAAAAAPGISIAS
jgi:aryl-alcohol dehydrogenase-like predicted oxidoreductase